MRHTWQRLVAVGAGTVVVAGALVVAGRAAEVAQSRTIQILQIVLDLQQPALKGLDGTNCWWLPNAVVLGLLVLVLVGR